VQLALEYGFRSWPRLKFHVEAADPRGRRRARHPGDDAHRGARHRPRGLSDMIGLAADEFGAEA
jgi:hypothetical protein